VVLSPGTTVAQENEAGGELLLLATNRTGTMSDELRDAAARGYRVLSAAGGNGSNEILVALVPTAERNEYRLVATERTSTFELELNDHARDGYPVHARTVTTKLDTSLLGGNRYELLTIMERAPSPGPAMQYRLLATSRTGTLQDELRAAQADGWELVTLIVRSEVAAVLEKPRPGD
jgi:hypothetical protein